MIRQYLWLGMALAVVGGLALGFVALKPIARARIVVRDDSGPVSGAVVRVAGFRRWENGGGTTDSSGVADVRFQSFSGIFEIYALKEGYYFPQAPRQLSQFLERRLFTWSPWPTNLDIVIRKIGNPVAMYAKSACAHIDVFGQRRGYDLVVGDWVTPYGAGKTNDFTFELRREVTPEGKTNEALHFTFANPGDGIQSCYVPGYGKPKLPMPALAPVDGYRASWKSGDDLNAGEGKPAKKWEAYSELNYYFRVRTQLGTDGRVTRGYYGKIYDGILFETGPNLDKRRLCSPGIYFTYYLNPDGTRNTEYSGQNLLQGEGTQVRSP